MGLPRHIKLDSASGLIILGASSDKSLLKGFLFANYINFCLSKSNLFFDKAEQYLRQTDKGSEFIGSIHAKKPSAYSLVVSSAGFSHVRIFPGAHRMQADVESFHNIIEREFFEIESCSSRNDFMENQLFFNLKRKNSYKEHKTPYQLAKIKEPSISDDFFRLPPIDLDAAADLLPNFHVSFGNDVHASPSLSLQKRLFPRVLCHCQYPPINSRPSAKTFQFLTDLTDYSINNSLNIICIYGSIIIHIS